MIKRGKMRSKKAAIEMSMNTIITIVLSVVFLILALTVLRNMYGFQTESIGAVQDKTLSEINKLYLSGEESASKVVISLGSEKTANIRAGTDNFGIEIGAGTIEGNRISNGSQLQFKLELDETSPNNCVKILGKPMVVSFFKTKLDPNWIDSLKFSEASGATIVYVGVPAATRVCSQIVKVQARDNTLSTTDNIIGQDYFTIDILRKLPFT